MNYSKLLLLGALVLSLNSTTHSMKNYDQSKTLALHNYLLMNKKAQTFVVQSYLIDDNGCANPNKMFNLPGSFNSLPITELLLQFGADPHEKLGLDMMPIAKYIKSGKLDFIKLFIKYGVKVDTECKDHPVDTYRLLHVAAIYNQSEILKFLLESGANPLLQDKTGKTCLHFLAASEEDSLELKLKNIEILLDHVKNQECAYSCNLDKQFKSEAFTFLLCLKRIQTKAGFKFPKPIIQLILVFNVDMLKHFINMTDKKGKTALNLAYDKKLNKMVEYIETFKKDNNIN